MQKWVAGLAAPERNKAKILLKKYACAFAMNNSIIDTGEARPIKPRSIPLAKRNEVKELVDDCDRLHEAE